MKKKILSKLLPLFLLSGLLLSSCGSQPNDSQIENSQPDGSQMETIQTNTASSGNSQEQSDNPQPNTNADSESSQPDSDISEQMDENVITLGVLKGGLVQDKLNTLAASFNITRSPYQVTVKEYGSYDNFITDVLRGQGADLFCLEDLPIDTLAQKGILEDLTPYFASSDTVHQEDLFNSIWEAGTCGDKMVCVIPSFTFEGIIVEKGHTNNGAWTIADYIALADAYPDNRICENITDPSNLFLNDLSLAPELYIDWEAGVCRFDSSEFVEFIGKLKEYSHKQYKAIASSTPAEKLYNRDWLTSRTIVTSMAHLVDYMMLKNMLGEEFELAGFPGMDGEEPCYRMHFFTQYIYGMNAFSEKKEGAWAFLEYLLSNSAQKGYAEFEFPARKDILDPIIQQTMEIDLEITRLSGYNSYTLRNERVTTPFTEEDRQELLNMLDHTVRFSAMESGRVSSIITEELNTYFEGSKTAEETAAVIQNRIQLFLDEMQ